MINTLNLYRRLGVDKFMSSRMTTSNPHRAASNVQSTLVLLALFPNCGGKISLKGQDCANSSNYDCAIGCIVIRIENELKIWANRNVIA